MVFHPTPTAARNRTLTCLTTDSGAAVAAADGTRNARGGRVGISGEEPVARQHREQHRQAERRQHGVRAAGRHRQERSGHHGRDEQVRDLQPRTLRHLRAGHAELSSTRRSQCSRRRFGWPASGPGAQYASGRASRSHQFLRSTLPRAGTSGAARATKAPANDKPSAVSQPARVRRSASERTQKQTKYPSARSSAGRITGRCVLCTGARRSAPAW